MVIAAMGAEDAVPDTKDHAEVLVCVPVEPGMMDPVRLRCDEYVPQNAVVRSKIAVIYERVTTLKNDDQYRIFHWQIEHQERYQNDRLPDQVLNEMNAVVGEHVHFGL